jgi:hypothetical protein
MRQLCKVPVEAQCRLTVDAACAGRYRVIRNRRKNNTFIGAAVCDVRGCD